MRRFISMQRLARWLVVVSAFGVVALAGGVARADTVTFGPKSFELPKKFNVSKTIGPVHATTAGKIKAKIEWHTRGFLPNDPNIRVRAELFKGDQIVKHKEIVLGHKWVTTILEYQSSAPAQFKVRVRAIDTTNAMDFEGKVSISYPIATVTLPVSPSTTFHLDNGNTEYRTFELKPNKKGKLEIKATWDTDFLGGGALNPRPLTVTLKRPDGSKAKTVTMKSALQLTYQVQQGDLDNGRTWTLVVHNLNTQYLENIRLTVRFTPSE